MFPVTSGTNFRRELTKEAFGDLPNKEEDSRGVGQRSLKQKKTRLEKFLERTLPLVAILRYSTVLNP